MTINNEVDKEKLLIVLEKRLEETKYNNFNIVYLYIDSHWNGDKDEEVTKFYKKLKYLANKYNQRFAVKYILNELNKSYVHSMILEHNHILVYVNGELKLYKTGELLDQSMNVFSYYYEIEDKYRKEMMRVEHLKSMGELTEGIVHDLNNVFSIILGSLDLIRLNGYKDENTKYLDTIYRTVTDWGNVGNTVLSHMKGSKITEESSILLYDLINFTLDIIRLKIRNLMKEKDIELKIRLKSTSYIYINEYEIRQVLLNIMFNGIDAILNQGTLEIETYDENDTAILIIRDDGIGMNEDTLEKIYYPYFTTKGDSGTGIGLNMAKKIFDKYDIKVEVKSQLNKGTEFKIFFPIENKI